MRPIREVAHEDRHGNRLTRLAHDRRRRVVADEIGTQQLARPQVRQPRVVAEHLGGAVVVDQPVVLPFDVSELGVDESLDLRVPAQLGRQVAQAPRDIAVAAAGRYRPVFRVDQAAGSTEQSPGNN